MDDVSPFRPVLPNSSQNSLDTSGATLMTFGASRAAVFSSCPYTGPTNGEEGSSVNQKVLPHFNSNQ